MRNLHALAALAMMGVMGSTGGSVVSYRDDRPPPEPDNGEPRKRPRPIKPRSAEPVIHSHSREIARRQRQEARRLAKAQGEESGGR